MACLLYQIPCWSKGHNRINQSVSELLSDALSDVMSEKVVFTQSQMGAILLSAASVIDRRGFPPGDSITNLWPSQVLDEQRS